MFVGRVEEGTEVGDFYNSSLLSLEVYEGDILQ